MKNKPPYSHFLILLFLAPIMLTCCASASLPHRISEAAEIGLVETRGNIASSRLIFYDKDLNECDELRLPYAGLVNDSWESLDFQDGKLVLAPVGYDGKKNEKKILDINLKTLESQVYDTKQVGTLFACHADRYFYAVNNLNWISNIARISKDDKSIKNIEIPAEYVSSIHVVGDKIIAFSTSDDNGNVVASYLRIYNLDLELIKQIETTDYASDVYNAVSYNGYFYFVAPLLPGDRPNTKLIKMNLKNYEISSIDLKVQRPSDIVCCNGKIVVNHINLVTNEPYGVSIYSPSDNKVAHMKFEKTISDIEVINDMLYGFNWDREVREVYALDSDTLQITKSSKVSNIDNNFSYIAGIFGVK